MTAQHKNTLPKGEGEGMRAKLQLREKRMKTMVNRRRTAPSAISKALSKSRNQASFSKESPYTPHTNDSFTYTLTNQNSVFIMDDQVQISKGLRSQERHILLFSDKLIIAKSKSSSSLKVKKQVQLCEIWIATCVEKVSQKKTSTENSFVIGWPTTNCVITFSTSEAKEKWFSALQWQINEMKRDEYPKKIAINNLLYDEADCSSVVTVMANNTDTADAVIETAVQQLRIMGRPADYYLCVISGKDETPSPLIGHEYPFSIIMNCLRDGNDLLQGSNNNNLSEDSDISFFMEQLPKDRQCRFILKPRPPPPLQLRQDAITKHSKRKSLIDWAFRRSSSVPSPGSVPDSPITPQKLFGLSLSSVCQNGILPKPIMDMLLLLYHDGPSTKGIFRRSANAKTCKELKEKLNSGNDVQMDGESVFVAAAVITDFLRNIPDSILSSQMYELWMEAMETENTEAKLGTIKRLVQQLPEANFVLLHHLFGVLHHIEKNSEENQMTASNLALCIAPNMLWLPSPTGPEEESKSTRKVATLIQFLIENAPQIFGEDTASLFNRLNEEQQRNVDALLDMDLIQTPDSSDELELAFSYQERRKYHKIKDIKPFFGTQNECRVEQRKKSWGLFDETCTSFKTKAENNDSANSCENLDCDSFYASGSICSFEEAHSFEPSRDRCSSEPSVCLRSRLAAQVHEPVTRQFSYDTALTHSSADYLQQLKKLQLEGQTLAKENQSPKQNNNKYSVWRSPQVNSRMKHIPSQKVSLSNRSSFSSLSSTTTSASASSLSSLDSAMSYCSDSPLFSPQDVSSLPFMFGTSARLHTLSSESSKFSKEWSITTSNTACSDQLSESNDNSEESSDGVQQRKNLNWMSRSYAEMHLNERGHNQAKGEVSCEDDSEEDVRKHASHSETFEKQFIHHTELDNRGHIEGIQGYNSKSMVYADKEGNEATPTNKEQIKRTKITFYMTPGKVTMRSQSENKNSGISMSISRKLNADGENQANCSVQTSKLHIPQTVFYGQNTPLVLQSVARKYYEGSGSQMDNERSHTNRSRAYEKLSDSSGQMTSAKSHSRLSTVKHAVHIVLPTSVQNTVKEYFTQSDVKTCQVNTKAVEKELLRSKLEWHNKHCTDTSSAKQEKITFVEESFV